MAEAADCLNLPGTQIAAVDHNILAVASSLYLEVLNCQLWIELAECEGARALNVMIDGHLANLLTGRCQGQLS